MNKYLVALLLISILPVRAGGEDCRRIVMLGSSAAGVFESTLSPDHKYAIGWTILQKNASAQPVQWISWNPDASENFFSTYGTDDYETQNCVIDLKGKKIILLRTDEPDYPHKNRGNLVAAWAPAPKEKGPRCAIVQNDSRFYTDNLWLITIDDAGMHQRDIAADLAKALAPLLREKRPVAVGEYATMLPLKADDANGKSATFQGDTVTIPFVSDIEKSEMENSAVEGTITVHLPDGKVIGTHSDTPVDDPFVSNAELAKADHELNAIYIKLSAKLGAEDRAALRSEQIAWLDQRDNDAATAVRNPPTGLNDLRAVRDAALVDDTKKRAEELHARLK